MRSPSRSSEISKSLSSPRRKMCQDIPFRSNSVAKGRTATVCRLHVSTLTPFSGAMVCCTPSPSARVVGRPRQAWLGRLLHLPLLRCRSQISLRPEADTSLGTAIFIAVSIHSRMHSRTSTADCCLHLWVSQPFSRSHAAGEAFLNRSNVII